MASATLRISQSKEAAIKCGRVLINQMQFMQLNQQINLATAVTQRTKMVCFDHFVHTIQVRYSNYTYFLYNVMQKERDHWELPRKCVNRSCIFGMFQCLLSLVISLCLCADTNGFFISYYVFEILNALGTYSSLGR